MTRGAPQKIIIRGVEYPSRTAAANALGITPSAITLACSRGKIETVGLYKNRARSTPVTIGGVTYEDRRDAAVAIGVRVDEIQAYMKVRAQLDKTTKKVTAP